MPEQEGYNAGRNRTRTITATLGILVLLAIVIMLVSAHGSGPAESSGAPPAWQPTGEATQPYRVGAQAPSYATATSTTTDALATFSQPPPTTAGAEDDALQQLQRLHDQDVGVIPFGGQYVAQLASKNVGIVDKYQFAADGSHTFRAIDILNEHLNLRRGDNGGATVVLLLSTDFGTRRLYNGAPLWMTMADNGFRSAADVTAWCAARFPTLSGAVLQDHCTPHRLEAPVG